MPCGWSTRPRTPRRHSSPATPRDPCASGSSSTSVSPRDRGGSAAEVLGPVCRHALAVRTRFAQLALALGAGFAVALSLPPWGFWPLAVVGVALLELSEG